MENNQQKLLIEKAQQGDSIAFEALLNEFYGVIYRIAYKWCVKQQDAQDITQDVCIKLGRAIHSYKGESAFTSWLYPLVINTGKDWYRKNAKHVGCELTAVHVVNEDKAHDKIYANQVLLAINQLPDAEREALLLVVSEGVSHKEAAKVLGCKEGTISWRIHEARKKLSSQFKNALDLEKEVG